VHLPGPLPPLEEDVEADDDWRCQVDFKEVLGALGTAHRSVPDGGEAGPELCNCGEGTDVVSALSNDAGGREMSLLKTIQLMPKPTHDPITPAWDL